MICKILVVDDELLLERMLKLRFRQKIRERELEFVFAHNGREALETLLADRQFDMVLTDLNMPEMDGFTFLEQLQEIDSHLPAVVMSGDEDMASMKTAIDRGAVDFVTKPIDFHALEVKISKVLQHVRQMKATMTPQQLGTEGEWGRRTSRGDTPDASGASGASPRREVLHPLTPSPPRNEPPHPLKQTKYPCEGGLRGSLMQLFLTP